MRLASIALTTSDGWFTQYLTWPWATSREGCLWRPPTRGVGLEGPLRHRRGPHSRRHGPLGGDGRHPPQDLPLQPGRPQPGPDPADYLRAIMRRHTLRADRPVVVFPHAFDQPFNARLLDRCGLGFNADVHPPAEALDRTLHDAHMQARAGALAAQLAPHDVAARRAAEAVVAAASG